MNIKLHSNCLWTSENQPYTKYSSYNIVFVSIIIKWKDGLEVFACVV